MFPSRPSHVSEPQCPPAGGRFVRCSGFPRGLSLSSARAVTGWPPRCLPCQPGTQGSRVVQGRLYARSQLSSAALLDPHPKQTHSTQTPQTSLCFYLAPSLCLGTLYPEGVRVEGCRWALPLTVCNSNLHFIHVGGGACCVPHGVHSARLPVSWARRGGSRGGRNAESESHTHGLWGCGYSGHGR